MLRYFVSLENIILICGRYEGVDERAIDLFVDMEVSIGDYVLTGGEIPAMVIIDGVIRLIEGIVGKGQSLVNESFEQDLLDFPQYTRPEVYKGLVVPEVLLSGNHGRIEKWRKEKSLESTYLKTDNPEFKAGDKVKVNLKIKEETKERIQSFEGIVIKMQGGGINKTFTVRKISFNVGVERTFLLHSPMIASITKINSGIVRRAKLYYIRKKIGKKSKIEFEK